MVVCAGERGATALPRRHHADLLRAGTRLGVQFDSEPPIVVVTDGRGGPEVAYRGTPLAPERIAAIHGLKAPEARRRFGDSTLAGGFLVTLR